MAASKTTQDGRQLKIETPMEKDFFLLSEMKAKEEISRLFSVEVDLLHEENEASHEPTEIDIASILGQNVTITIKQQDEETIRRFNGMINSFATLNRNRRFTFYKATIVPRVWLLTQNIQSRIFQNKSVPEIIEEVFEGYEFSNEIQGDFKPRNYCVQYNESDFDFASRIMEEEGIYFYFEHSSTSHKLIFANTTQSHLNIPVRNTINYAVDVGDEEGFVPRINYLQLSYNLQSGKITYRDYDFQLPTNNFEVQQPSLYPIADNQNLEIYKYPGGYTRKYDGIARMGGDDSQGLNNIFPDKQRTAETTMSALDSGHKALHGTSNTATLTAGHRFKLEKHPSKKMNAQYIISSILHEAEQSPKYISDEYSADAYKNSFDCLPHGPGAPLYAPARTTPKPVMEGCQTATVVGPDGEEIFTDKYGRVKVQFHWDRHGVEDASSSCWVRVAQVWASSGWGSMFIPRIGMEVIVNFVNGDVDNPIITGCVYNAETMPAYTLPDEKTKSGIKTNSSKGGNGFNELRFEDEKSKEQVFIHAEKDFDLRIKNDSKEIVKRDRHLIVERDKFEKVDSDKHLQVGGDKNESVGGTVSLQANKVQDKVDMNYAIQAGMEIHLKAGMNVVIEAGSMLTFKAGGSTVSLGPSGVTISGAMVNINSGGGGGSGSGSSPNSPEDPKEADNAETGESDVTIKRNSPPPPPTPPTAPPPQTFDDIEFSNPNAVISRGNTSAGGSSSADKKSPASLASSVANATLNVIGSGDNKSEDDEQSNTNYVINFAVSLYFASKKGSAFVKIN